MRPDDGTELDDDDLGSRPEPRPQPLGQPLGPFRRVEVVHGDIDSAAITPGTPSIRSTRSLGRIDRELLETGDGP